MSELSKGNQALREKKHVAAIAHYLQAWQTPSSLALSWQEIIGNNIRLAGKRYRQERASGSPLRVAVAGYSLSHNAAGRAYTLAQLYATFCDTEIFGTIDTRDSHGKHGQVWEPLREAALPIHSLVVDDESRLLEQALNWVAAHPYDVVHLSKPRTSNILFGLLYKLIWNATVLMDIDDEELAFVGAITPLSVDEFLHDCGHVPTLKNLNGEKWTRLAVWLARAFDGVTVSNPALQQKYGGTIIRHARDEAHFKPSPGRKEQSRQRFNIPQDKKVVLFFGTPREHKGLLETARALAALNRPDLLFLVVGSFPGTLLRKALEEIPKVDIRFLGNQPFATVPDVVAAGDICVLLQDPEVLVSQFQAPAKLTDALAMGLTLLAQSTPALADLEVAGAFIPVTAEKLVGELRRVLDDQPDAVHARAVFEQHLSFAANVPRLKRIVQTAQAASKPRNIYYPLVEQLDTAIGSYRAVLVPSQVVRSAVDVFQSHVCAPGVSIVVLTHNAAHHLDTCLSSFFSTNTHQPVEMLIIDHASTDHTAEVVAKYASRGDMQHIRRDRNYTFSESCNFGASRAKHPHLLFLNDDIVFSEDVLGKAVEMLRRDDRIGAVGVRLDDVPQEGKVQGVQHLGIEFKWNEKRGYHQPAQIRCPSVSAYLADPLRVSFSSFHPGVTGAFLLVRKSDFVALQGFNEEFNYGLEDIDFCLRLGRDLKKKCWCINSVGLQHVEGATRKEFYTKKSAIIEKNHVIFKKMWDEYICDSFIHKKQSTISHSFQNNRRQIINNSANHAPRILFILPQAIESNNGYQVQLLSRMLQAQGLRVTIAIPDSELPSDFSLKIPDNSCSDNNSVTVLPYSRISESNFQDFDVIHAWTPREIVRECAEKLLARRKCPLIVHLEDNEEYLTGVTAGNTFSSLAKMSEAELDKIIPTHRFHPIRGRKFLGKAQGLTMVVETLNRFNPNGLPYLVIPPIVDERLFYPRPLNTDLRKKHKIPDDMTVLVYTGNVHAGNKDEVFELYRAVDLLNQQGCPVTLFRTGQDTKNLDTSFWPRKHEIHLGWVERDDLPDIMAAADIYVQPGTPGPFNDERIPCKLPEYFAMGRPVILPRTNLGLKVKHGVDGYVVEPADARGIADAVREILSDHKLTAQLAERSVDFYLDYRDLFINNGRIVYNAFLDGMVDTVYNNE